MAQPFEVPSNCEDQVQALAFWQRIAENPQNDALDFDLLADELSDCLGSSDSELRDELAYGLLANWLRNDRLSAQSRHRLIAKLTTNLQLSSIDSSLVRSFSALILSELLRADAISEVLSSSERKQLLQITAATISAENDYRGFVVGIGWVHPIAHEADLLWRFALHPDTGVEDAELILPAIRTKAISSFQPYSFNEPDRMARVIASLVRRELPDTQVLVNWLDSFAVPENVSSWTDVFGSIEGMNELHNTKQFIRSLSDQLSSSQIDPEIQNKLEELVKMFTSLI